MSADDSLRLIAERYEKLACLGTTGDPVARQCMNVATALRDAIAALDEIEELTREAPRRCEGRYPVPRTAPPRDEPFLVTYRCPQLEGHAGPHGQDEPQEPAS